MSTKLLQKIIILLEGLLLGFVLIATPGVSGGTVAVIIGLFAPLIANGNQLFHDWFKKPWWDAVIFCVILVVGAAIGAFIGSKVVTFTHEKYPIAVTFTLIGFIIGSIPMLYKNIKVEKYKASDIITFVLVFALALVYTFCLSSGSDVSFDDFTIGKGLGLVAMGIVTVATMIIPGISGNIFLLAFGYYYSLTDILSNIFTYELSKTLPVIACFLVGCVIGAILILKVLKILLDKFNVKTNIAILGFVVASPIIMVKLCILDNANAVFNTPEVIVGVILGLIALALSFIIGRVSLQKQNKNEEN